MKTETLIRALAADRTLDRPLGVVLLAGMIPAVAAAVLMLWATLGFRADLAQTLVTPVSAMRFVLTGALGLIGVRLALVLGRPEGSGRARFWPVVVVMAVAAGLLIWAYVATPAEGRQMAIVGKTMVTCLVTIPLLSILPVTAIMVALRRGAPTAPTRAGLAAGIGGSGFAALVYATHCTEDSPLFYVTWYGLAICGVVLASALIGSRVLRW